MSYPYGNDPQQPGYGGEQPYGTGSTGYPGQQPYPEQPYPEQPYVGGQPYDYGQAAVGNQQGYNQPYGGYPYAQPYPGGQRHTNGMAIGALIASVSGVVLCGISSLVGAILGHVALGQIRRNGEDGHGLALAAVIVGWIVTAVWVIYWLFVAIAASNSYHY